MDIWSLKGDHILTVSGHSAPIKGVAWIGMNDDRTLFASAKTADQKLKLVAQREDLLEINLIINLSKILFQIYLNTF